MHARQASFDFLTLEFLSQGAARAVGLPARSFDLARPGVAPPLIRRLLASKRRDSSGG